MIISDLLKYSSLIGQKIKTSKNDVGYFVAITPNSHIILWNSDTNELKELSSSLFEFLNIEIIS
ncbi:MAG: hypothetical protein KBG30_12240 [Bacteroidales bacterium]|nr:hypothetical protein [Bacteroidales bacterium]